MAMEVQEESQILLGKILVMINAIAETDLLRLMRKKAEESIYDVFLWTEGNFEFVDGELPDQKMVPAVARRHGHHHGGHAALRRVAAHPAARPRLERRARDRPAPGHGGARRPREADRPVHRRPAVDRGDRAADPQRRVQRVASSSATASAPARCGSPRQAEPSRRPRGRSDGQRDRPLPPAGPRPAQGGPPGGVPPVQGRPRARPRRRPHGRRDARGRARDQGGARARTASRARRFRSSRSPSRRSRRRSFSPHEGFVLSRINGQWDVKSIMKISPMKELDVLMIFQKLYQDAVIRWKMKRATAAATALSAPCRSPSAPARGCCSPSSPRGSRGDAGPSSCSSRLSRRSRSGSASATPGTSSASRRRPWSPPSCCSARPGRRCSSASSATRSKSLQRPRRFTLANAFDVAQLALAYGAAALFCSALNAAGNELGHGGRARHRRAHGLLLRQYRARVRLPRARAASCRAVGCSRSRVFQLVALLLLAPIVILEVLVYLQHGVPGMLLAFFPVVLASFVMRNLSSMEKRVREISRRNLELDAMRDISTTFGVSARVDRYERVFSAISRLLPVQAAAVLEWAVDGDEPSVHVSDGAAESRRDVLAWARRSRSTSAASTVERARGALDRRRASGPSGAGAALPGPHAALHLRDALGPARPRERVPRAPCRPRRSRRCGGRRAHRPRPPGPLRAGAGRGALPAQSPARRDPEPDPRGVQRPEAATARWTTSSSRSRPRWRRASATRGWFSRPTSASATSSSRGPTSAPRSDGTSSARATFRRRRSRAGGRSEHRVSKSFHVRDRRAATARRSSRRPQEPRRVLAAGEDAWRAEELIWIPLYSDDRLLGCLSVDDPRDGRSPSAETIQAARDLRQPGGRGDRERALSTPRRGSSRSGTR